MQCLPYFDKLLLSSHCVIFDIMDRSDMRSEIANCPGFVGAIFTLVRFLVGVNQNMSFITHFRPERLITEGTLILWRIMNILFVISQPALRYEAFVTCYTFVFSLSRV